LCGRRGKEDGDEEEEVDRPLETKGKTERGAEGV